MKALIIAAVLILVCALLLFQPGGYLVVNNPEKSDAIVMLGGSQVDGRYWRAMELLRGGYGQHLLVDVDTGQIYGQSYADLAGKFIAQTAGANAPQVSLCMIEGDSTKEEAAQVAGCLARLQLTTRSAVLVTDDYHTRRALSIFRHCLPQIHWTAASDQQRLPIWAALVETSRMGKNLSYRMGEAALVGGVRPLEVLRAMLRFLGGCGAVERPKHGCSGQG